MPRAFLRVVGLGVVAAIVTLVAAGPAPVLALATSPSSTERGATTTADPATTTTLESSPNPSTYGQAVTFRAVVTPASGTTSPPGTVTFLLRGGSVLGTVALSGGTAMLTTSTLAVGTHLVYAVYHGAFGFTGSSSSAHSQVVNGVPSSTTVGCAPGSVTVGQASLCTATVSGGAPGGFSGSVDFSSDSDGTFGSGGSCTVTDLSPSCSVSYTPAAVGSGTHTITASFGGDVTSAGSSGSTTLTVTALATSTAIVCAPGSVTVGQASLCTATVSGGAPGGFSGSVDFSSDSDGTFGSGGSCTVTDLSPSCSVSYTPAAVGSGTHTITASFGGDAASAPSSGATTLMVTAAATTIAISSSANPSDIGQSVTFTATVTATADGPGGTVTFYDGTAALGTSVLAGGTASLTVADLSAGTHRISAAYGGDPDFLGSTSSVIEQDVVSPPPATRGPTTGAQPGLPMTGAPASAGSRGR